MLSVQWRYTLKTRQRAHKFDQYASRLQLFQGAANRVDSKKSFQGANIGHYVICLSRHIVGICTLVLSVAASRQAIARDGGGRVRRDKAARREVAEAGATWAQRGEIDPPHTAVSSDPTLSQPWT